MKRLYLYPDFSEFTAAGEGVFESPVYDLYDNDFYKNFSTIRSPYGTNLLEDNTWTGYNEISTGVTESGYVDGDRFIDTSARVDIVNYWLDMDEQFRIVPVTMEVFASNAEEDPDEWISFGSYQSNENVDIIDCFRYVRFVVSFGVNSPVNYDDLSFRLLVRVEIDPPIVTTFFRRTGFMLDNLPEWMEMREYDNREFGTATPTTIGGKYLNAIAGEWIEKLANDLSYLDFQRFIGSVDINQAAWVYKVENVPAYVFGVKDDAEVEIPQASSLAEFLDANDDDDLYYWDETEDVLFFRKAYDSVSFSDTTAVPTAHHIWNWIDEIGLIVDLDRLPLESNEIYRKRILDVYVHRPGTSVEAFKNTLRRELDLWAFEGATPDSDYEGATPEILSLSDLKTDSTYYEANGIPKERFISLVMELAEQYPTTWGKFIWGRNYYDMSGPKFEAYDTIPFKLDSESLDEIVAGVGDKNDLLTFRPREFTGANQFSAKLKLRGKRRASLDTCMPKATFDIKITGVADIHKYTNPLVSQWFTLSLELLESATPASTTIYTHFQLQSKSDVKAGVTDPTASSYSVFEAVGQNGNLRTDIVWYDGDDGSEVDVSDTTLHFVTEMTLEARKHFLDSGIITNAPGSDTFEAWFEVDSANTVKYGDLTYTITDDFIADATVVMKSKSISYSTEEWESEGTTYRVSVNGDAGYGGQLAYLVAPLVDWHPNIESGSKYYRVSVFGTNGLTGVDKEFGGWTTDANSDPLFLPVDYFQVNSSDTWTIDTNEAYQDFDYDGGGITLEFQTSTYTDVYPFEGYDHLSFEAEYTQPLNGLVDENGPWVNDEPSQFGATDNNWLVLSPTRADFGIPDTDEYIPTWMGVEITNNENVLAWLDTNVVKPVNARPSERFPDSAIEEVLDGSTYGFKPFAIRVKLRPDIDQHWYPEVSGGWFYWGDDEFYLYSDRKDEVVSPSSYDHVLEAEPRLGAPIIVRSGGLTLLSSDSFNREKATPDDTLGFTDGDGVLDPLEWQYAFADPENIVLTGEAAAGEFTTPSSVGVAFIDAVEDDILLKVRLGNLERGYAQVMFGMDTMTFSGWFLRVDYSNRETTVSLIESTFGSPTTRVQVTVNGTIRDLSIKCFDNTIYVTSQNRTVLTYSGYSSSGSIVGFFLVDGSEVDDFSVYHVTEDADVELRQIAFADEDGNLTLLATETVTAGENGMLYLAYSDVYDIVVNDPILGGTVPTDGTSTATNEIGSYCTEGRDYIVNYVVNNSFYVDHDYLDEGATPSEYQTRVVFDKSPDDNGVSSYVVSYEQSIYKMANPVDLPLSPLHTSLEEGFIYIDYNEYDAEHILIKRVPEIVIAVEGFVTTFVVKVFDLNGNPKPNVTFEISADWGTFISESGTTGEDGTFVFELLSEDTLPVGNMATVTITESLATVNSYDITFPVYIPVTEDFAMYAAPSSDAIPCDGRSQIYVYGKLVNKFDPSDLSSVAGKVVQWAQARFIYELFAEESTPSLNDGYVITNSDGTFTIGPFTAEQPAYHGYWFVSVQTDLEDTSVGFVGDVVFWREYPIATYGIDDMTGLPIPDIQMATPISDIPPYADGPLFPALYDEATGTTVNTPTVNWLPPRWYAMDWFTQYQLGILGSTPDTVDPDALNTDAHMPGRDV